ncbi:hypothetical protein R6Q59_023863 [Mikania micrantha]
MVKVVDEEEAAGSRNNERACLFNNLFSTMGICFDRIPSTWKNRAKINSHLVDLNIHLRRLIKRRVGDGSLVSFWLDTWDGDEPLADMSLVLYGFDRNKTCHVSECLLSTNRKYVINWNWVSMPASEADLVEFERFDVMPLIQGPMVRLTHPLQRTFKVRPTYQLQRTFGSRFV